MKNNTKTNKLAIASFVLGLIPLIMIAFPWLISETFDAIYLSTVLFYLPLFLSFVFGIISLVKIRKDNSQKGKIYAVAGIIFSVLTVLIVFVSSVLLVRSLAEW